MFTAQRWWSVEELKATTEVVFPADLGQVLDRLLDKR